MTETGSSLPDDDFLGYIFSVGLEIRGPGVGAVIITRSRIILIHRPPFWGSWGGTEYLGPGSTASDSERSRYLKLARKLEVKADSEFEKEEVTQILYKRRAYADGHVLFKTTKGDTSMRIAGIAHRTSPHDRAIRAVMQALLQFAPDRLYDEDSGNLVADDLKSGKDYLWPGEAGERN